MAGQKPGFRGSEEERFFAKVKRSTSEKGCWIWAGALTPDGYGQFGEAGGRVVRAHRWAYQRFRGDLKKGQPLDHLCRVRRCVNPYHVEPVEHVVNVLRGVGVTAMNSRKLLCPKGHSYDRVNKRGSRECSICVRAAHLSRYHANKKPLTRKGWTWRKKAANG